MRHGGRSVRRAERRRGKGTVNSWAFLSRGGSTDRLGIGGRLRGSAAPSRSGLLARLRAVVVLGGSVRAKGWVGQIGRSVLDLPVTAECSVLAQWYEQAVQLAAVAGVEHLSMEVVIDRASPMPRHDLIASALPGCGVDKVRI